MTSEPADSSDAAAVASTNRPRVFSGIQPTGILHLGNLIGAVLRWPETLDTTDSFYCVVDLHAITVPQDPAELREGTLRLASSLIASGVDPQRCTLFVQSHVAAHAELGWIMQCMGSFGELGRMVQFKEKRDRADFVSTGLFAYPALQAADILAYDTDEVPIGDDQRQHLELARNIAERLNSRYGPIVKVPLATVREEGTRVKDLQIPTQKMSKSSDSDAGVVLITDSPATIAKKFKRAVTDSESEVRYDPATKPGVSNLLSILGAATGRSAHDAAQGYTSYGPLKGDTADAVIALIEPIQRRIRELEADPGELSRQLRIGADRAREVSAVVRDRVFDAMGFLAP